MRIYQATPGSGIDGIALAEVPDPAPGPGQVLVRVRAVSLNYRDLGVLARAARPTGLVSDGAGDVVAVGPGVTRFSPGDRVTRTFFPGWVSGPATVDVIRDVRGGGSVDGMLAEMVVVPEHSLVPTPSYLSDEEAATLPCAAVTAWAAMFEAGAMRPGQSVLLLGTGGVSIFGLQLARIAGIRAIITSSSDDKLARARDLGADVTINYRARDDWDQAVLEATGGRGVDVTLEVGGEGTMAKSLASTRFGGLVALIGGVAARPEGAPPAPSVGFGQTATRILVGSRAMFEDMNRALEVRRTHPVVDRVFPFEEARAAYRHLQSQVHFGKVVIRA